MLAGDALERGGRRARDGAGGRAEAGLRAAVLDVLGEHHEVGADRRLGGERRGPRDVVVDVVARLDLDEGDAQHRHGPMVRAGPAAGTV